MKRCVCVLSKSIFLIHYINTSNFCSNENVFENECFWFLKWFHIFEFLTILESTVEMLLYVHKTNNNINIKIEVLHCDVSVIILLCWFHIYIDTHPHTSTPLSYASTLNAVLLMMPDHKCWHINTNAYFANLHVQFWSLKLSLFR